MSSSLIYLRNLRVGLFEAHGPLEDATQTAWTAMNRWLADRYGASKFKAGYGVLWLEAKAAFDKGAAATAGVGSAVTESWRYQACVELSDFGASDDLADITVTMLPGGVYVRRRFVGDATELARQLASACESKVGLAHLALDPTRPIMTVMVGDRRPDVGEPLRAVLLLPVAMAVNAQAAA
ncbi:MAG: hypothetical protein NW205_11515 [Hyphomicrobiaceae bacterium]|nr:hypothetical protein [Hyphomicrobiaceae bacterium]